jgi:hypothetical protein
MQYHRSATLMRHWCYIVIDRLSIDIGIITLAQYRRSFTDHCSLTYINRRSVSVSHESVQWCRYRASIVSAPSSHHRHRSIIDNHRRYDIDSSSYLSSSFIDESIHITPIVASSVSMKLMIHHHHSSIIDPSPVIITVDRSSSLIIIQCDGIDHSPRVGDFIIRISSRPFQIYNYRHHHISMSYRS